MKKFLLVYCFILASFNNVYSNFFYETSTTKEEDIEMFGLDPSNEKDVTKYDNYSKGIQFLTEELKKEADITILEIGGGRGRVNQQIPAFVPELAKKLKNRTVKIIGVDPNYLEPESLSDPFKNQIGFKKLAIDVFGVKKYKSESCGNLEIVFIPTLIPYNKKHEFYTNFAASIENALENKKIFIINSYVGDIDNIPYVMDEFKKAKKLDNSENILLFSQSGLGPWILLESKGVKRKLANVKGPNIEVSEVDGGLKLMGVLERVVKEKREKAAGGKVSVAGKGIEEGLGTE